MNRLLTSFVATAAAVGALCTQAPSAYAWEPVTQAGIAEEAVLRSDLHSQLVSQGWSEGVYSTLAVPDASLPALVGMIRRISPSLGVFLDAKGAGPAMGWIVAGAIIADIGSAQHHFLRAPQGKQAQRGWQLGVIDAKRAAMPRQGQPAVDWVVSKDNPLGAPSFYDQYAAAISSANPAERQQHMAAALLAAGAVVHVLADMGSPSHVRGDEASHAQTLSIRGDLGNRLERVAALAFGRLGVPAPNAVISFPTLRDYFVHAERGLAVVTAGAWYSENTLPHDANDTAVRPALPQRLSLMAASQEQGTTLRNDAGVCLARYKLAVGRVTFWLDDECRLEQAGAILPTVTSYAHGALQFLFRGRLQLTSLGRSAILVNAGVALGRGTISFYSEAANGTRALLHAQAIDGFAAAAELEVTLPDGTPHAAIFSGVDAAGEQVVAVGVVTRE